MTDPSKYQQAHESSKEFCEEVCANVYLRVSNVWKVSSIIISICAGLVGSAFAYSYMIDVKVNKNTSDIAVFNKQAEDVSEMKKMIKDIYNTTCKNKSTGNQNETP